MRSHMPHALVTAVAIVFLVLIAGVVVVPVLGAAVVSAMID
jgi:hypothetical protein